MRTIPLRTLATLSLSTLLACASGKTTVDGPYEDLDTGLSYLDTGLSYDEPPSTIQCGAFFEMLEHNPPAAAATVGVTESIEGLFRVRGNVEETESDACDLTVEIRLVIDTNTDPTVLDWAELPVQRLWHYEGDGEWWLGIVPQQELTSGEIYAVEADFHVADELPYGYVWSWTTAP